MKWDMNVKTERDVEIEKRLKKLVGDGYTKEDGTPLKCTHCNSTDLEDIPMYRDEYGVCEYKVMCKSCDEQVGYCVYGQWDI